MGNVFRVLAAILLLGLSVSAAASGYGPGIEPEAVVADPLAPAEAGLIECDVPDPAAHTCRGLVTFTQAADGSWMEASEQLVSHDSPVTFVYKVAVRVREHAVCGTMHRGDVMAGVLKLKGITVLDDRAQPVLAKFADQLAADGQLDVEICYSWVTTARGLVQRESIDGVPGSRPDSPVSWVDPKERWFVGSWATTVE